MRSEVRRHRHARAIFANQNSRLKSCRGGQSGAERHAHTRQPIRFRSETCRHGWTATPEQPSKRGQSRAETQYNKDGLLQGQGIDSPLSEIGVQQAEAAGQYLQDVHFTNVFASDMKRAKQTAEIIVKKNKTCSNLDIVTAPSLKERSFGIAEGGQVEDMKNMAKASGQPIPEYTPPEGETMDQVKIRISTFLKSLFQQMAEEHQDKISQGDEFQPDGHLAGHPDDGVQNVFAHALVVSHGAYMRVAMRYFIEDLACTVPPEANMAQLFSACPNTGMCRFIVTLKCSDASVQLSGMKCVFVNRRDHVRAENS